MWRRAWLLVVVGACYAPTLITGAPCEPTLDNCPTGQVCELRAGEFRCAGPGQLGADATIEADAAFDAPSIDAPLLIDAMSDASTDAAMIDAPLVTHVEYVAAVADCVNPLNPNPDTCKTVNGTAQIAIDSIDSTTANPWVGYIRFNLDGVIAGRIVTSVKLRAVATSDSKATSNNTGQVWRVNPFARSDLFAAPVPARMGAAPLAGSQGSVTQLQVINWTLPVGLVTANGSVYLEVSTTASDGTTYWNLTGPNPPRLVIDLL